MILILIVMLGLLSAGHTVAAAPWALPPGVKTLEVNGYPMAFFESGTGESVVLVHGGANRLQNLATTGGITAARLSAHWGKSPSLLSGTVGWKRRHVFHKTAR